jgi:hypothetical protein
MIGLKAATIALGKKILHMICAIRRSDDLRCSHRAARTSGRQAKRDV